MEASSLTPDAPLPDDVQALQALVRELLAEVTRLRAANAELQGKLDQALKHRFGRRSNAAGLRRCPATRTSLRHAATNMGAPPCPNTLNAAMWSTT